MLLPARGFLFDLDGTLVDSIKAVDRSWGRFCARHGLAFSEVAHIIHGRRSLDSIPELLPGVDAEAENLVLRQMETEDTEGVVALPGAIAFLEALPAGSWGIVTSGTSDVARARMKAAGIPEPNAVVFGEDVQNGKPFPDPYLLGAIRLGFAASDIIAFEDTQAGVNSILSAGMLAIAVGHDLAGALIEIREYSGVQLVDSVGSELSLNVQGTPLNG